MGPIAPNVQYSYHITLVFVFSLSPMTPNGETSRSLLSYQSGSIWYACTALLGLSHTRATRDQAMLLDLGCSEVVQRMIIRHMQTGLDRPLATTTVRVIL